MRSKRGWLRQIEGVWAVFLRRLGLRPIAATVLITGTSLIAIAAITAAAGIPEPEVHDELAQLVEADIFAHGRLSEPPHPFWEHFETIHVLSQPSYQGKYPPGLALLMAAGQSVAGVPIAGVWLAGMILIASTGYAAQGWLPPRWAVLTTVLVALRFGMVGDWAHSYWGGAVAASGGALVFGAVGWLRRSATLRDGLLLGAGLVLLALSRPYEGVGVSAAAVALMASVLVRPSSERRRLWRMSIPAAAVVASAGVVWLSYYNWRVTGSPVTLPYMAYEREYSTAPLFVWEDQRTPAPTFRNREMERFERTFTLRGALRGQTGWPFYQIEQLGANVWNYTKPTLVLALLGIPFAVQSLRRAALSSVVVVVAVLAAMSVACWVAPRYMAPLTAPLFVLVSIGLSGLGRIRLAAFKGRTLALLVLAIFVASVAGAAARYVVANRASDEWWAQKRRVREQLLRTGGDDLVFVRYSPAHRVHEEWVYNGADIDRQPIVWSRELDAAADRRLREYFKDRRAWIVFADQEPARLVEWTQ